MLESVGMHQWMKNVDACAIHCIMILDGGTLMLITLIVSVAS